MRSGKAADKAGQAVRESRDFLKEKAEQAENKFIQYTKRGENEESYVDQAKDTAKDAIRRSR